MTFYSNNFDFSSPICLFWLTIGIFSFHQAYSIYSLTEVDFLTIHRAASEMCFCLDCRARFPLSPLNCHSAHNEHFLPQL